MDSETGDLFQHSEEDRAVTTCGDGVLRGRERERTEGRKEGKIAFDLIIPACVATGRSKSRLGLLTSL